MSDEITKFVLGDTAISALEEAPPRQRRFFGRRKPQRPRPKHCENCGAELTGHWCAKCGQPAIDYRRSFRHIVVDLLDEFLNWDSKFFRTMGLLLVRPWKLTNEFLAGHRVRYVHPLRLYLLASILFFFAVNYSVRGIRFEPGKISEKAREDIAAAIAEKRNEIEAELNKENFSEDQRRKAQEILDYLAKPSPAPTAAAEEKPSPSPSPSSNGPSPAPAPGADEQRREYGKIGERPFVAFDDTNSTTPFERWIEGRARDKMGEQGTKMGLFIATLISNLPYMVLCCIPLFALVLKILYIRRKVFYIDHLIYALHIHSFAYLAIMLLVALTIGLNRAVPGALAGWIIALLWVTFAVQIFLSIRRVYRQGWFFSVFKFFLGGFVYLIVLLFALAVTFFVTIALP